MVLEQDVDAIVTADCRIKYKSVCVCVCVCVFVGLLRRKGGKENSQKHKDL